MARPVLPAGPLADLKNALYGLYLSADTPPVGRIRERIRQLADGDDASDPTATPSNDTIHGVLSSPTLPANIHHVIAVAAALLYPHHVPGVAVQVRGNPRIDRIRQLWERAVLHQPPGAIRVRDARARVLGVHAAIRLDDELTSGELADGAERSDEGGAGIEGLPVYVPRDLDVGLGTWLTTARQRGGFVLLKGDSSVGKTRALLQALREIVPEWWLLHPADPVAISEFASAPTDRTVIWLDELQNYLDHVTALTAVTIQRMISSGVVVVSTLWPAEYDMRTALPRSGQPDHYAKDRQLLKLAEVISVPGQFSAAELRRAEELVSVDRRIRIALDAPDAGFTQVMAGGPLVIHHWEHAPAEHCYGKAIITAALDARRVGSRAPVTRKYLAAAAPGYLTPAQQATASVDWLEQALDYATQPLHGAIAALTPIPAGMGQIAGYELADYLHQHALRLRRTTHLPDIAWQALVEYHHSDDTLRLADNAERRGRHREAEILYQQVAENREREHSDVDDQRATYRLGELLVEQGRFEELAKCIEDLTQPHEVTLTLGGIPAAVRLAELLVDRLAEQGRDEDLAQRANAGDRFAANRLAELLVKQGRVEELTQRANAGDEAAANHLAKLLAQQGCVDDLAQRAAADDLHAAYWLVKLLIEQRHIEEAIAVLRPFIHVANGRQTFAAAWLAELLAKHGCLEELTQRADAGDRHASCWLAKLLASQGRVEEAIALLRPLTNVASDYWSMPVRPADLLADLLAQQGLIEELTQRADAGNDSAARHLAKLLAEQGCIDELAQRADAGDRYAASHLAKLLAEQGRVDELAQRADAGDGDAARHLADVLAEQGRVEELAQRADAGELHAGVRLGDLLTEQRGVEKLTQRAKAGTPGAVASYQIAWLIAEQQGWIEDLAKHADASDPWVASQLAKLLAEQNRIEEAIALLRPHTYIGDGPAGAQMVELLAAVGWTDELDGEVAAGTPGAVAARQRAWERSSTDR